MKPIDKGAKVIGLKSHQDAKPDLVVRVGAFCSYCERQGDPQDLHVEHIYSQKAHSKLAKHWDNFLLACSTCNTNKRHSLGDGRQHGLLNKYLWPHIDNTSNAFEYDSTGCVKPNPRLSPALQQLAKNTLGLAGLEKTPAEAATYAAKGIAYDPIRKRKEAWGIAQDALTTFRQNPTVEQIRFITLCALKTGFFSVWMTVFKNVNEVRLELIQSFKACPRCFDPTTTQLIPRGRL